MNASNVPNLPSYCLQQAGLCTCHGIKINLVRFNILLHFWKFLKLHQIIFNKQRLDQRGVQHFDFQSTKKELTISNKK